MTQIELDRIAKIKERLRATTPGAWRAVYGEDERFLEGHPEDDPCIFAESGQYIAQTTYDGLSHTCRSTVYADTEFIANSKSDVAFLLRLLEVLLGE